MNISRRAWLTGSAGVAGALGAGIINIRNISDGGGLGMTEVAAQQRGAATTAAGDEKELIFHTTEPRNGGPALPDLVQSWLTPTKYFYVRSHASNPVINADEFRLQVEGMVSRPSEFSLGDLKSMNQHTITATLTCAGNRRIEFNRQREVGGVQWHSGAIGNAEWTGVSLADVLKKCGVQESAKHVWFEGLDEIERDSGVIPFGASIPIEKAMIGGQMPGALLAHGMNHAPLTADHGFPLRTVVPGYIGARSVKWLGRIVVSDRPSPNHYVQHAYKIVTATEPIDWAEAGPIYRYPINAAVANPKPRARVKPGKIQVNGYVLPSGRPGVKVERVQVSIDGGRTWINAKLTGQDRDYCWQLWEAEITVTNQTRALVVRAQDTGGGFMPGRVPWNAKGYLQNSWYRVPLIPS